MCHWLETDRCRRLTPALIEYIYLERELLTSNTLVKLTLSGGISLEVDHVYFPALKSLSLISVIIINGSSPSHLKPNTEKNKTQNLPLHFQRSSSCTRQNTNNDKTKAMNGKVKQLREDKPPGQAQAVTTQNRYTLLQDERDQS